MKTPQQWLDLFTAQDRQYDRPTAEANIKAVQQDAIDSVMRLLAEKASPPTAGEIGRILKNNPP